MITPEILDKTALRFLITAALPIYAPISKALQGFL